MQITKILKHNKRIKKNNIHNRQKEDSKQQDPKNKPTKCILKLSQYCSSF